MPGGADWGLVGSNGNFNPDVSYALETQDGDNIFVRQRGRAPNVFSLFDTGSEEYAWLNLVVAYGVATVSEDGVSVDLWQVSMVSPYHNGHSRTNRRSRVTWQKLKREEKLS